MPEPITAVLPIFNCRERLARHLESVKRWAPQVEELVVVDSGSSDGSLELAREILGGERARFLHNPPGLYQSWNAGIASATAEWCYISTVEDPITPEGLTHLLEIARRHGADVVVSPPEMRSEDGSQPVEQKMPSNLLADSFRFAGLEDRLLSRGESIALLCGTLPHGLLGSSASNLYRTAFLQAHPFPTDVGHCGDTAWGVTVAPIAKVAFTPRECARFYCQTKHSEMSRKSQLLQFQILSSLALESLKQTPGEQAELTIAHGWLRSHLHQAESLWEMLAAHEKYEQQLFMKYQGGIFSYLLRAVRDEWKKFLKYDSLC